MLNQGGVTKTSYTNVRQILANEHYIAVPAIVDNTVKDSDSMAYAGKPLYGNLRSRGGGANAFVAETTNDTATKGVYTVSITVAASFDDTLMVEGVAYTCAATESVEDKKFIGATVAAQITSLLKMVVCDDFVVTSGAGVADTLQFTQKVAKTGDVPVVTATAVPSTGTLVIGDVTTVAEADTGVATSNANCVLLHDIEFSGSSDANATVLVHGMVDKSKVDTVTAALITDAVVAALVSKGIYVI